MIRKVSLDGSTLTWNIVVRNDGDADAPATTYTNDHNSLSIENSKPAHTDGDLGDIWRRGDQWVLEPAGDPRLVARSAGPGSFMSPVTRPTSTTRRTRTSRTFSTQALDRLAEAGHDHRLRPSRNPLGEAVQTLLASTACRADNQRKPRRDDYAASAASRHLSPSSEREDRN